MDREIVHANDTDLMGRIFELEAVMENMPQVDIEVRHHFAPGLYAREMLVPAGVTMTGKIHKTRHLSIMLCGKMVVVTPDGSKEIEGPLVQIAEPGVKRAGHVLEPVRWITVHVTDETDIETLEAELVTNDVNDLYLEQKDELSSNGGHR